MTTSCSSTPTTPYIEEPRKRTFEKFTVAELDQLKACREDRGLCTMPRQTFMKVYNKMRKYRDIAEEAVAAIRANNNYAK